MWNFIKQHFDTIITVFVTIIGFIITYIMTKKNMKNEVMKNKLTLNAEAMKDLPYEICQMMNRMIPKGKEKPFTARDLSKLLSKVLAYGSKEAIDIAIKMQTLVYSNPDGINEQVGWETMAAYSLLITQIKYDLSSEIISPESWFNIKITDYSKMKPDIKKAINKIVEELNLNKKFYV